MTDKYNLPVKVYENGFNSVYLQKDSNGNDYARYFVEYDAIIKKIQYVGEGFENRTPVFVLPVLNNECGIIPHIDAGAVQGNRNFVVVNLNDELTINRMVAPGFAKMHVITKNQNDKLLIEELSIPGSIDDYEYSACYYVGSKKQPASSNTHNDGAIETILDEIKDNNTRNIPQLFNLNTELEIEVKNELVAKLLDGENAVCFVESQGQM